MNKNKKKERAEGRFNTTAILLCVNNIDVVMLYALFTIIDIEHEHNAEYYMFASLDTALPAKRIRQMQTYLFSVQERRINMLFSQMV